MIDCFDKREYMREWRENHPDYHKNWYEKNKKHVTDKEYKEKMYARRHAFKEKAKLILNPPALMINCNCGKTHSLSSLKDGSIMCDCKRMVINGFKKGG